MANRTVEDYLALPYHIEVVYDTSGEEPGWFARVLELPGCMTQADSFEALGPMIQDAMRGWIEIGLEDGQPIPEPLPEAEFSGKFVLRVPRSLHRQLAEAAERDAVSLNAFISAACARAVGAAEATGSLVKPTQQAEVSGPAAPRPAAPGPAWQPLSDAAWRAFLAAGREIEAQAVDERLFAGWLQNELSQVSAALDGGYGRDAIDHLQVLSQAVGLAGRASPLMQVFSDTIQLLQRRIEHAFQLEQNYLEQTLRTRAATQVFARQVTMPTSSVRERHIAYEAELTSFSLHASDEGELSTSPPRRPF